jgi:predicted Zn-dependent protease
MFSRTDYYNIINYILKRTRDYDAEVLISGSVEGLTRFANSEIHQNVYENINTINIKLLKDNKKSELVTTDYSEKGLDAAIKEAIQNLEYAPSGDYPRMVKHPILTEMCSQNSELVKACTPENRALQLKESFALLPSNYQAYGIYSLTSMRLAYGNNNGVKRFLKNYYAKVNVLVSDGNDGTSYYSTLTQNSKGFSLVDIFKHVINRASINNDRKIIEPGEYTVILEPAAVASILMYLSFAGFNAKSVQDNYSFLSGKVGEKVFDERITIVDDWHNKNTMPLPFDLEGFERKKLNLIVNGVAHDLAYDALTAKKDEKKSTGHSVAMPDRGGIPLNLVMEGGIRPLEDIIKDSDNAILVTRFHYMNLVNPRLAQLTALTRDGLFQIENGEITHALENMRFTESILDAFNDVVEISSDRKKIPTFLGNYYVPAMKIRNFKFTGKTK